MEFTVGQSVTVTRDDDTCTGTIVAVEGDGQYLVAVPVTTQVLARHAEADITAV